MTQILKLGIQSVWKHWTWSQFWFFLNHRLRDTIFFSIINLYSYAWTTALIKDKLRNGKICIFPKKQLFFILIGTVIFMHENSDSERSQSYIFYLVSSTLSVNLQVIHHEERHWEQICLSLAGASHSISRKLVIVWGLFVREGKQTLVQYQRSLLIIYRKVKPSLHTLPSVLLKALSKTSEDKNTL